MIHYITYDDTGRILSCNYCDSGIWYGIQRSDAQVLQVQAPIDITQYRVEAGELVVADATPELGYDFLRFHAYGSLHSQLALLYDDVAAGKFGTAAQSGLWFKHCEAIKQAHPKNK